jgi:hypothetical protein
MHRSCIPAEPLLVELVHRAEVTSLVLLVVAEMRWR